MRQSTTLCAATNLMSYRVYNCLNTSEIYEDRLYRCYGVFQENGLVYTPVRRLDLPNKVTPLLVLVVLIVRFVVWCRNVLLASQ